MVRAVPIGEYEPTIPVQEGLRRIIPEVAPSGVGAAIGNIGSAVEALQQKAASNDASEYVNKTLPALRVAAEQHLENNSNKSQDEIDEGGGYAPSVMADFQKSAKAALDGSPNKLATRMLNQGIANIGANLQIRAMRTDAAAQLEQRTQSVLKSADMASTAAELNPQSADTIRQEQQSTLDNLRLDPEVRAKLSAETDDRINQGAARGFAKQSPLDTLTRLKDPNDSLFAPMTEPQRAALTQYTQGQLVTQKAAGVVETYRTQGAGAGNAAFAALDKDPTIPAELRDEVRTHINAGVSQLRTDAREQHTQQLVNLEENIAKGTVTAQDRSNAWGLYHSNALDASQLAGTLASIDRAEIKQTKDGISQEAINDAYVNHKPLDPKDKDVKDAVGDYFLNLTQGVQPGTPEYASRAAQMAVRTGVMPEPAVSWARANLTSGQPQQAAAASDLIARVEEANPRSLEYAMEDKEKAMADSISKAVAAGTPPQIAVDQARQNATLPKAELENLQTRWNALKIESTQPGALLSLLRSDANFKPSIFTSVPEIPPAMQGEFDEATRRYYNLTGGNTDQSQSLALRDIGRTWGVSEVNGKREIMAYAPERMFPGLTAPMVRDDIAKTVAENPQSFQHLDPTTGKLTDIKPKAEDVRLIATDRTARTGGLEWSLGAPDEFGAQDVLRGKDGNPLTYRLPVSSTDFDAVRQRQAEAAIAKARIIQANEKAAFELAKQPFGVHFQP